MSWRRVASITAVMWFRPSLFRRAGVAPPETWDSNSVCAGWLNRDIMAHLAAQEVAAAQLVAGDPAVEFDAFREAIPFDETRHYVKVVLRNAAIYARLYAEERPVGLVHLDDR